MKSKDADLMERAANLLGQTYDMIHWPTSKVERDLRARAKEMRREADAGRLEHLRAQAKKKR